MTKRHIVYTIGMICTVGKFCGFRIGRKLKNNMKVCGHQHYLEIAREGITYDKVFDTTRPEIYLNKPEKGATYDTKDSV
jgi:hypothetical protein